jgi:hypothetical protein
MWQAAHMVFILGRKTTTTQPLVTGDIMPSHNESLRFETETIQPVFITNHDDHDGHGLVLGSKLLVIYVLRVIRELGYGIVTCSLSYMSE